MLEYVELFLCKFIKKTCGFSKYFNMDTKVNLSIYVSCDITSHFLWNNCNEIVR